MSDDQPGAFHDSKELLATVMQRLSAWIKAQPAADQIAYFNEIRRPDLAAKIAATQPNVAPEAAARTLSEHAGQLVDAKKFDEALKLLQPHVADPRKIIDDDLEWAYLCALRGAKKWDVLLDIVPRLWKVTALSDRWSQQGGCAAFFVGVVLLFPRATQPLACPAGPRYCWLTQRRSGAWPAGRVTVHQERGRT